MSAPEIGPEIDPEIDRAIVGLDARAVRASVQIVSQASAADLARPTPCPGWTLAELLAHMTAQHNGFAAAAAGDGADLVHWQTGAPVDDPVGEYAAAAERVMAAFAASSGGPLGQIVALLGRRPGWPGLSAPSPLHSGHSGPRYG
jgi:uncharacterized protein (TIGR03083 family)